MALSRDTHGNGFNNSTAALTYAAVLGSTANLLVVFVWTNQTSISTVTYNGVSMTQLSNSPSAAISNSRKMTAWVLAGPATGSNNLVITPSSTGQVYSCWVSYVGASLTQPDSNNSGSVAVGNTTITGTTTVVASNCWLAMAVVSGTDDALGNGSAGTGTTWLDGVSNMGLYDSNGIVASGSRSLVATLTAGTDDMAQCILSIAPLVPISGDDYAYFM